MQRGVPGSVFMQRGAPDSVFMQQGAPDSVFVQRGAAACLCNEALKYVATCACMYVNTTEVIVNTLVSYFTVNNNNNEGGIGILVVTNERTDRRTNLNIFRKYSPYIPIIYNTLLLLE